MTNGYLPIMAHPERYFYYHNNYDAYNRLKDLGFLLQVNLLSLTGYYGKPVAKVAKYLFEEGMVDLVGTDMHHTKHLSTLKENVALINQYIGGRSFNEFK
jgi:protein-tyrosine phosphatase